mmetsp:Transcript_6060/g.16129  ORF Transcript_6060/g.16129 Transcript_6060/m.16129 type:complete len:230 (+) Transcript_6060:2503-3192(+)
MCAPEAPRPQTLPGCLHPPLRRLRPGCCQASLPRSPEGHRIGCTGRDRIYQANPNSGTAEQPGSAGLLPAAVVAAWAEPQAVQGLQGHVAAGAGQHAVGPRAVAPEQPPARAAGAAAASLRFGRHAPAHPTSLNLWSHLPLLSRHHLPCHHASQYPCSVCHLNRLCLFRHPVAPCATSCKPSSGSSRGFGEFCCCTIPSSVPAFQLAATRTAARTTRCPHQRPSSGSRE